jgi:hypothetical protein
VIEEVAATSELVFRFVEVALVRVAFPPAIFAVVMLAVAIFEVVEFVVEAEMF